MSLCVHLTSVNLGIWKQFLSGLRKPACEAQAECDLPRKVAPKL